MAEVPPPEEDFMSECLRQMKHGNKFFGIPKQMDIMKQFCSEEATVRYLTEEGILQYPEVCPRCNEKLVMTDDTLLRCWHCNKFQKQFVQSIFKGSFLFGCNGGKREMMIFLYHWLSGATAKQLRIYTGWSNDKVCRWTRNVEELVSTVILGTEEQIGGPGIYVEIDESKFGKRKYHRGHRVEGSWVFGGVERTPERRVFLVQVEKRDRATLLPLIKRFIAPGSIIVSDCWAAYESIPDMVIDAGYGYDMPLYEHEAVNHERGFVGSDGRHSNTIEGTWYAVKRTCPVKKRKKKWIPGCLFQFMWRRVNEGNLWNALIRALVEIRYDHD